jgi:hypothetical protein
VDEQIQHQIEDSRREMQQKIRQAVQAKEKSEDELIQQVMKRFQKHQIPLGATGESGATGSGNLPVGGSTDVRPPDLREKSKNIIAQSSIIGQSSLLNLAQNNPSQNNPAQLEEEKIGPDRDSNLDCNRSTPHLAPFQGPSANFPGPAATVARPALRPIVVENEVAPIQIQGHDIPIRNARPNGIVAPNRAGRNGVCSWILPTVKTGLMCVGVAALVSYCFPHIPIGGMQVRSSEYLNIKSQEMFRLEEENRRLEEEKWNVEEQKKEVDKKAKQAEEELNAAMERMTLSEQGGVKVMEQLQQLRTELSNLRNEKDVVEAVVEEKQQELLRLEKEKNTALQEGDIGAKELLRQRDLLQTELSRLAAHKEFLESGLNSKGEELLRVEHESNAARNAAKQREEKLRVEVVGLQEEKDDAVRLFRDLQVLVENQRKEEEEERRRLQSQLLSELEVTVAKKNQEIEDLRATHENERAKHENERKTAEKRAQELQTQVDHKEARVLALKDSVLVLTDKEQRVKQRALGLQAEREKERDELYEPGLHLFGKLDQFRRGFVLGKTYPKYVPFRKESCIFDDNWSVVEW